MFIASIFTDMSVFDLIVTRGTNSVCGRWSTCISRPLNDHIQSQNCGRWWTRWIPGPFIHTNCVSEGRRVTVWSLSTEDWIEFFGYNVIVKKIVFQKHLSKVFPPEKCPTLIWSVWLVPLKQVTSVMWLSEMILFTSQQMLQWTFLFVNV